MEKEEKNMFGGPCLSLIMKAVVKRISHVSSWGKCIHTFNAPASFCTSVISAWHETAYTLCDYTCARIASRYSICSGHELGKLGPNSDYRVNHEFRLNGGKKTGMSLFGVTLLHHFVSLFFVGVFFFFKRYIICCSRQKDTMQSVELVLYIYIYIDIYIFLNVLFSVKWQVMFYYTYSNEEEVYIHSQGPFRTKKNNTALRRLKQTGRVEMLQITRGCFWKMDGTAQNWCCWASSSFSCLFFYRKLTNCQKEQKHLIMCHYKVSYRAPFWNCVFFIIHMKEKQHIVFGSQEERHLLLSFFFFNEFSLQYLCQTGDRSNEMRRLTVH